MADPNDPYSRDSSPWNWSFAGRRSVPAQPRVPPPPGARPKRSKAERDRDRRADARAERLHLVGLTNAGVIIMGVVLGAAVVVLVLVLVLVSHP